METAEDILLDLEETLGLRQVGMGEDAPVRSETEFQSFSDALVKKLSDRINKLDKRKWKIRLKKGEVDAAEVVERCVFVIGLAKDFVSATLASTPQGALAWTAVCLVIQVSDVCCLLVNDDGPGTSRPIW